MNNIYKHVLVASLLMVGGTAMAQTLNSAYFTEDYKFRHDMNPAFENKQNYISIPALGNINVNLQGNFGYQDVVMHNPMYGQEAGAKKMTTFMNPYISTSDALSGFSKGQNRIAGDVGIALLSAGFKGFGGYNTIEVNAKASFGVSLPYELFEFAKNTGNKSYQIGDISAMARSYVELGLGHSHKLGEKWRIGAKLKFLFGVGDADVKMQNVVADLSGNQLDALGNPMWLVSGKGQAQVSMKGFTYKSKTSDYKDPNHTGPDGTQGKYEHIDDVDVDGAGLGGFGMGLDLGAEYKITKDLKLSFAVLDLGFISWKNNMKAVNSGEAFAFGGFSDVAVKSEYDNTIDDQWDYYSDQLTDFINLKDEGDAGSRTTALATTVNLGLEYALPSYDKLSFGFLSSTRINGDFTWSEGRFSANWKPLKWLDGGINFAVSSFATSMGYVLNIHPKGYNFFIGMDHILGKTSKEFIPLSSNASLALGMSITW